MRIDGQDGVFGFVPQGAPADEAGVAPDFVPFDVFALLAIAPALPPPVAAPVPPPRAEPSAAAMVPLSLPNRETVQRAFGLSLNVEAQTMGGPSPVPSHPDPAHEDPGPVEPSLVTDSAAQAATAVPATPLAPRWSDESRADTGEGPDLSESSAQPSAPDPQVTPPASPTPLAPAPQPVSAAPPVEAAPAAPGAGPISVASVATTTPPASAAPTTSPAPRVSPVLPTPPMVPAGTPAVAAESPAPTRARLDVTDSVALTDAPMPVVPRHPWQTKEASETSAPRPAHAAPAPPPASDARPSVAPSRTFAPDIFVSAAPTATPLRDRNAAPAAPAAPLSPTTSMGSRVEGDAMPQALPTALPSVATPPAVSSGWTDVPTSTDGRPAAEALVESMRWQRSVGGGTMQVRLRPEHFGDVTVTVQVHQGQVSATLAAESPAAVEYLQREADTLRDMLHERGLVLARFEIRDRDGEARRDRHQQASRDLPRRRADHAQTQDIFEVVV